ncbi:MAG TPA: hypothetical protein VF200_02390 [Woeseiaceae bacterium]
MDKKTAIMGPMLAALLAVGCGADATDAPAARTEQAAQASPRSDGDTARSDLAERLSDPSRPAEDRARDASRKPAEVVGFLGIEPGMRVLDAIAAGGWYTEVLSIAVGPKGRVVAQNPDFALEYGGGRNDKALTARLTDDRLPNVTRLDKNFSEMSAADGPFDAAITALNFHDVYNGMGPEAASTFLGAIYDVLKPGGVLGITDHVGIAGNDNEGLHRIEKATVIDTVEAAGFELVGESDVLENPADDHTQPVFSDAIRGKTDRFVLKFRKPE